MNEFQVACNNLYHKLCHELDALPPGDSPGGHHAAAVKLIYTYIECLRKMVHIHCFAGKAEEIWLFKENKPLFASRFDFHLVLYRLYLHWPASRAAQEEKVAELIASIQRFYQSKRELFIQFRSNNPLIDELYFLRENYNILLCSEPGDAMIDPLFCTNFDHTLAQYLAYQQIEKYCSEGKVYTAEPVAGSKSTFKWAWSKTALVSLVRKLFEKGAFTGHPDPITVQLATAAAWGVKDLDYHATIRNLNNRKKNGDQSLDDLVQGLDNIPDND